MSSLAWMVGAWAMLAGFVAPQPPVEALETRIAANMGVDTNTPVETPEGASGRATREYIAVTSAYSCDYGGGRNPMHPCGPFRDGSTPHAGLHGLVAAGPYEWLGRTVYVEGFGSVRLTDTPRNPWYGNQPHIDLFLSYDAAVRWGIQERTVYLE